MLWWLEWGHLISSLPDDAKCLRNRPSLTVGLEIYIQAYQELQSERQIGMAVGLIPFTAILKWCEFSGLDSEYDVDKMIRYLRALEEAQNKKA